ncbi:unnamed protein product [Tuber aestivum]|uniref:SRR1-like domain-containing protein n=1 Tax=Tuber aestivum TaxID=59557 RepID=A0A292Q5J5_9PEZI|nr:unnamed protein product [Tuber aestivum]
MRTTGDDGWINIPAKHKPPKTLPEHQKRTTLSYALQRQSSPLAPEHIAPHLNLHTQTLLKSTLWTQIRNVLVPLARGLNRLVVFGLGSFSGPTASSTYYQFVLVREIAELLGIGKGEVYFQDPVFTKCDKGFLEDIGSVVEVGRGENAVQEETVVVAVHLEYEVLEGVVKGRPGVVGVEGEVLKWDIDGGGAFNHSAVYRRKVAKNHGSTGGDKVDGENAVEDAVENIRALDI